MAVRVDARELISVLDLTPPDQNVMLVGRHGIGKSQIISEHFRKKGMQVISFFLGQMSDPGDLIGLLHKDEHTGRSEFLPPYWWPEKDTPIVLFLDELNRARPEILQSVMELTLNKTLAGKRLPAGSMVVSAVNEGDEYQLTDLDPALVSRFNLYEFAPTTEDWLLWAQRQDLDPRVITFIQRHPHFLDGQSADPRLESEAFAEGLVKTPDRRGWARVSALIRPHAILDATPIKLVAGIVGAAAANAFRRSVSTENSVSPNELLLHFGRHKKSIDQLSLAETVGLNEQLMIWLQSGKCPQGSEETVRENLQKYLVSLQKRQLEESVAHFVATLGKTRYEETLEFLLESLELTELLTRYMDGIRVE